MTSTKSILLSTIIVILSGSTWVASWETKMSTPALTCSILTTGKIPLRLQLVYITGTGKPAGFTRVYGLGKGPGTAIWTPPKTRTRHGLPVTHFGTRHKNVTPPSRLFHTT